MARRRPKKQTSTNTAHAEQQLPVRTEVLGHLIAGVTIANLHNFASQSAH
jgi:hypothetical protein